MAQHYKS